MKKILLIVLFVALIFEIVLTALCFFAQAKAVELFGMTYNKETEFLGYIIAWFCLLVSIFIYYAIHYTRAHNKVAKTLVNILGFWWIFLGIGVYLKFGKLDNVFLDTIKGVFLVTINYLHWKEIDA